MRHRVGHRGGRGLSGRGDAVEGCRARGRATAGEQRPTHDICHMICHVIYVYDMSCVCVCVCVTMSMSMSMSMPMCYASVCAHASPFASPLHLPALSAIRRV